MSGKNDFADFMAVARGEPGGDPDFAEALAAIAYTMDGCLAWFRSHLTGTKAADVVAMAKLVEARRLERRQREPVQ